jgi:PKD repeat protein
MFAEPERYLFDGTDAEDPLPAEFPLDATARNFDVADANIRPIADFTESCIELLCTFDASASDDEDGTIDSYSWEYGDGAIAEDAGFNPSHTYAAAGTYTVFLAVTDNEGAVGIVSRDITVTSSTGGNAPTASFTFSCTDLACNFDASGSTDDGNIVSYRWNFGDGSDPVTEVIPGSSYTYATAGSYTVTLVVTDDENATSSTTQTVGTTAPVVRCNISQTGKVPNNNYDLFIVYDGARNTCTVRDNKTYTCAMDNVISGDTYVIDGSGEVKEQGNTRTDTIYDERTANCAQPNQTQNY